ncbi:NADP-dependent phosphogluconate dehydrogenase [Ruegeria marina]|uniref:6-phosphogluconate dehydrogenase, decarboxylating n=1 Tax=Ruegeria marina TaxID=639004 RepID=A0A1G6RVT3_9RHOB|nr:NADP-dependent phosphogluconate dehydrogenase [Ruegeria marina]SDD08770.1 6-phosphogluconate dehydrogenase [Ruegeria marina]
MGQPRIGLYGLGTMGSALALNFAGRGIDIAVANREAEWLAPFLDRAGPLADRITGCADPAALVLSLPRPRLILLMIPSGAPVDAMIDTFLPLLSPGDTLIDAGNSDFHDTRRRTAALTGQGIGFVGLGVSGGEEGARNGPSMMLGGSRDSWSLLRPLLEPIAARFQGDPCVAHMGPDGAGHFVKTVHNGIEYADMQMIAEVYGLMRDGAGWGAARIGALFAEWDKGPLRSFLVETTARVLAAVDPETGQPMVDLIRDRAGQKGTGRWTVIEALRLGQSASVIEAAVAARGWSGLPRLSGAKPAGQRQFQPEQLENALQAGRLIAHLQGFGIMRAAAEEYGWPLDLARVAEIWRAGCIIRSDLLDRLAPILRGAGDGPIYLAPEAADLLSSVLPALRASVSQAVATALPVPALSAALAWADSLAQPRGTANLIQAQRDAFGRHGFERIDRPGEAHFDW